MCIRDRARSDHVAATIPFVDILNFSILSCMRVGEVCKIRWEDVDEKQKAVLVSCLLYTSRCV
ncbi:hypothetical protein [Erwinia amylovora]